jgi:hypothetical protein
MSLHSGTLMNTLIPSQPSLCSYSLMLHALIAEKQQKPIL